MACVLVAEDSSEIRDILRKILEFGGFEVFEVSNGKEAIESQRKISADILITDILMPEKDGIETILEFRRDFPSVKILAISGGGRLDKECYLNLAKRSGADRTLTKPFCREKILGIVNELIG